MSWVKDFDNQTRTCSHSSLNSSRQKVREDRFVRLRYRWTPSSCNLKLRPSFVLKKLYNPFHRSDKSEMLCFVYISSFISLQKISLGVDEERLWITKIIPIAQGNMKRKISYFSYYFWSGEANNNRFILSILSLPLCNSYLQLSY